jgi:hypothetical protein
MLGVEDLGLRVWGLEATSRSLPSCSGFGVEGLGFPVEGLEFRVEGFRV